MAALADLALWALALVCLGIAAVIVVLLYALFSWLISLLNEIPKVNIGTDWLHSTEQAVLGALGGAFGKVNHLMGASLHLLARYADDLWREIAGHANLLLDIASHIPILGGAIEALRALLHHSVAVGTGTAARVRTLEREYHGIEAQIKSLERDFSRGIGHDVLPRLKHLDREVAHIEGTTIPAIQEADKQASDAISNLYEWAKGKASLLGIGTFAAAVTGALALVGNGWLACKENPFSKSKNPCGLWANLARFMPLLGLLAVSFDFPEFVSAAEDVAGLIGDAVQSIEGQFPVVLDPLPPPQ